MIDINDEINAYAEAYTNGASMALVALIITIGSVILGISSSLILMDRRDLKHENRGHAIIWSAVITTIALVFIFIAPHATLPNSDEFTESISEALAEAGDVDSVIPEKIGKDLYTYLTAENRNNGYFPLEAKVTVGDEAKFITLSLERILNEENTFNAYILDSTSSGMKFTAENVIKTKQHN